MKIVQFEYNKANLYSERKISSLLKAEQRFLVATNNHHLCLNLWPLLVKMSTHPSSPFDPERRVRSTLKKVFGFDSFKTPLQEKAIMAVVKGNIAKLPVFTFVLLQSTFLFFFFKYLFLFIWLHRVLVVAHGNQFPDQGSNPAPLYREHRVLATGPPGNSLQSTFLLTLPTSPPLGIFGFGDTDMSPYRQFVLILTVHSQS